MANPADGSDTLGVVERGRHDEIGRKPSGSWPKLARRTKRWLDLTAALVMLVVLAPVMSLIAIIVRLDSAGPALFRQVRVGQNGKRFHILKFRTLTHGAPSCHHERYIAAMLADCHGPGGDARAPGRAGPIAPFKDPNTTRVGRWLRKTSLDELPQLVNVLRSDMSLVGPRPLPPYEIAGLTDWARGRLTVPQGMTGLWQVSGRSTLPYARMLELDLEYVDRWSLGADLLILLKTLKALAFDWDKTA